jgi:hypothetical protein
MRQVPILEDDGTARRATQIIGHGVPTNLSADLRMMARAFFAR